MEERSKLAASTAAVVPFHCVICFEEFNLKERYPVVLPCGHTFVCSPCSKRLKRCMECREPLFYTASKSSSTVGSIIRHAPQVPRMYSRSVSEWHSHSPSGPSTPPQLNLPHSSNSIQIPYPIPKNLVLISMMEAAERQGKEQECNEVVEEEEEHDCMDGDEEYDLNQIINGMATLSGPCGTYAVKDPQGLSLISSDPTKRESQRSGERTIQFSASEDSIEVGEPKYLQKGQILQVVDFENGVAKLARGCGYVIADSNQLVKVGGPLETSCRLEGLLDTVAKRGQDLQKELDENNKLERKLREDIEAAMSVEPNHPVVTEMSPPDEISLACSSSESFEPATPKGISSNLTHPFPRTPDPSDEREFLVAPRSPDLRVDENGIQFCGQSVGFPLTPNTIDNADLNRQKLPPFRRSSSNESLNGLGYGCTAFLNTSVPLFENREPNTMIQETESEGNIRPIGYRRPIGYSSDGSGSPHHHHPSLTPTFTASFDTVDFRTGLSGHRGLQNPKRHAGHYSPKPRTVRMMGEHRGLGRVRGPNKISTSHSIL